MSTLNELIASYNSLAATAGLPIRKGFESKAKAEAAIASLKPKKSKGASLKIRKAGAVHEKGPRGFKFGPVWIASIVAGKGIALKAANLPKLKDTATAYGVAVTSDLTQDEIAVAIAKAM